MPAGNVGTQSPCAEPLMAKLNLHLIPTDTGEWAIQEEVTGQRFGAYPMFAEAESVARKLAGRKRVQLLVHRPGAIEVHDYRRWFVRWFAG